MLVRQRVDFVLMHCCHLLDFVLQLVQHLLEFIDFMLQVGIALPSDIPELLFINLSGPAEKAQIPYAVPAYCGSAISITEYRSR